jgi:hypothetical protein
MDAGDGATQGAVAEVQALAAGEGLQRGTCVERKDPHPNLLPRGRRDGAGKNERATRIRHFMGIQHVAAHLFFPNLLFSIRSR